MRLLRAMVPWLLLLMVSTSACPALSMPRAPTLSSLPTSLLTVAESTRLKLLTALARGDTAGALALYETHTGRHAPAWLQNLQVAYSAASQKVGQCQEVARTIHMAFSKLGQQPRYVAITALEKQNYVTFDLANGSSPTITRNGYHVVVMLDDMVYDAYTGSIGMKLTDYLSRLHAQAGVTWKVVPTP